MKGSEIKYLVIGLGIASILRIIFIFTVIGFATPPDWKMGDPVYYDKIGFNISQGNGFSIIPGKATSWLPPLYPLFLSIIYFIFGHSYSIVRIFQVILGTFNCLIIYLIAKQLFPRQVAGLAFVFSIISPTLIYFTQGLRPECLFTFLLCLYAYYSIKFLCTDNLKYTLAIGITIGLAMLTRGDLFFQPIFILPWLIIIKRGFKLALKPYILIVLFISLTVIPWLARGYKVHGVFIPIQSSFTKVLLEGNHPKAKGDFTRPDWEGLNINPPESMLGWEGLSEEENISQYGKLFLNWLKNNPLRYIQLSIQRAFALWNPLIKTDAPVAKSIMPIYYLYQIILLFFSLLAVIFFRKDWRNLSLFYILFLYFTLLASLVLAVSRFRMSLEPFIIILSAAAINELYQKMKLKF